jgi:putative nucleotidyltransferase-like protein
MEFDHDRGITGALSREAKLLVACGAVCAIDQSPNSVAALAANEIDWNLLQRMAAGHGMSAMVWRALSIHPTLVPNDVLGALRTRHLVISARSLYLTNELISVCELLEQSGVTAIAFKGPTLAAFAYRESGLREFSDLDLLVPLSEFPTARQTLIAHGYRPRCADACALTSSVFQCYEDTFVAGDAAALLDVHWRVLPRHFDFADPDLLQTRAQRIDLNGRYLRTLATEDLILFLFMHAPKHGWPLLNWIATSPASYVAASESIGARYYSAGMRPKAAALCCSGFSSRTN